MDTQPITMRLPPELHERLRAAAFARHVSMNTVVIAALEAHLDTETPASRQG